jgi:hypothetical protein
LRELKTCGLSNKRHRPYGRVRAEGEREMTQSGWNRQRQLAAIAVCSTGAIVGTIFAWIDSPFRKLSVHSLTGEWADTTHVFLLWLSHFELYWPWPIVGSCAAGLIFCGAQLGRRSGE